MEIQKQLRTFGQLKMKEPLSKHTTFKIGGVVDYFLILSNKESLIGAVQFLDEISLPYFIMGGGSNMLVSDEGFRGVALKYIDQQYSVQKNIITVGAGASTVDVANKTIKDTLSGFEWGVGVPGTIGGAIRGNAGASGAEMKDSIIDVTVYSNGEVLILSNKECNFGYRDSIFKNSDMIILSARLELKKVDATEGRKKALDVIKYRMDTQPKGYASTGCIFKNVEISSAQPEVRKAFLEHADVSDEKVKKFLEIEKISAGWLVEQAGCKGLKKGNAEVSPTHGNFIVNLGGAKASDIMSLIEDIKQEVYNRYRIDLEEEIQIISN